MRIMGFYVKLQDSGLDLLYDIKLEKAGVLKGCRYDGAG